MESVENSPFAIAIAQLVILVINAILYARQKSALDTEKRDRGAMGKDVAEALGFARTAKDGVDKLEVEHYKKLAAMFSSCCTELEAVKSSNRSLLESVTSLSNKLASRERADKAQEKRAAREAAEDDSAEAAPGGADLDALIRQHGIPMVPPQPAAPAARPSDFGRVAR